MKFVHAADLHLDSPIRNLAQRDEAPVDVLRLATRRAFERLVDLCLGEDAAFLILAGDLYDRDCPNMQVAIFLRSQLARLAERGVRTIIVKGNHDAQNRITSALELPATTILSDEAPQTLSFDDLPVPVALHGQSFRKGPVRENLARGYPAPLAGHLNIGVLHTSLAGDSEHDEYAPCAPADLASKGYGYWALGHIHKDAVLRRDPWIVYPGNLQGRHAKETGPKGAYLVETEDTSILSAEHRALDVFRWEVAAIDAGGAASEAALYERARAAVAEAARRCDGRPAALRITLAGTTPLSTELAARPLRLRQSLTELADEIGGGELWVEKILDATRPPERPAATRGDAAAPDAIDGAAADLVDIVREIAEDGAALAPLLRAALQPLRARLPEELKSLEALLVQDDPARASDAARRLLPLIAARLAGEPG